MIRKRYSPAQKAAIVLELLKEEETLPQIAARHGVHPNLLLKWKALALESLPKLFSDGEQDKRALESEHQRQLDELYGEQLAMMAPGEFSTEKLSVPHTPVVDG